MKIKLINFFKAIWHWRQSFRNYFLKKKLKKAVTNKRKSQRKLKTKIYKELRSFLGIDKHDDVSKFIPYDYKTRVRAQTHVYEKYGDEMRMLDVSLGVNLRCKS